MRYTREKQDIERIMDGAGVRPWDIRVKDPAFYGRVLAGGSLALGESYMDGWWE